MPVAVLPVRSFRLGKQRLSTVLSDEHRHQIGKSLGQRIASLTGESGMATLVVTGDEEVRSWAADSGLSTLDDPGEGLDGAATAGVAWAIDQGERWLVLHSDLPLLATTDLDRLAVVINEGRDVIAPSADGGTSAISSASMIDFAYGPASFHRHLPRLTDPVVVATTGLLHDLDQPGDLLSARQHQRGRWLDGIY